MITSARLRGRLAVGAASAALLLATTPAHALGDDAEAADWLVAQYDAKGVVFNDQYSFVDYGLTIDTTLALDELGGHKSAVVTARKALAAGIDNYTSGDAAGDPGSTYAGAVAKAAVLAQATGGNARAFGGQNLITVLEGRVATNAPIAGRIEDMSTYGDYANVIGQAFAARALSVAGSARAADATTFLLAQQCPDGFFRLDLTADKAAPDQGCSVSDEPNTDVTALAVLALKASGSSQSGVRMAIRKASDWLANAQAGNGSFGGGVGTADANANSTGLAGWALGITDQCRAAGSAARFVGKLQVPIGLTGPLSADLGAIAYDKVAFAAGKTDGITTLTRDSWRRSSAQAAPALLHTLSKKRARLDAPRGYVRGGRMAQLTVTRLPAGQLACLVTKRTSAEDAVKGAKGQVTAIKMRMPKRTGRVRFALTTYAGTDAASVKVLGPLEIKVKVRKDSLRRGAKQVVVAKRLAKRERVRVKVNGVTVAQGKTDARGRFKAKFRAGFKPGKAKVKVLGEFGGIRRGTATFKVRR
jgi:hypothetical protein